MICDKCGAKVDALEHAREQGYVKLLDMEKYHILLALRIYYKTEWCAECSSVEKKLQIEDAELAQTYTTHYWGVNHGR